MSNLMIKWLTDSGGRIQKRGSTLVVWHTQPGSADTVKQTVARFEKKIKHRILKSLDSFGGQMD